MRRDAAALRPCNAAMLPCCDALDRCGASLVTALRVSGRPPCFSPGARQRRLLSMAIITHHSHYARATRRRPTAGLLDEDLISKPRQALLSAGTGSSQSTKQSCC